MNNVAGKTSIADAQNVQPDLDHRLRSERIAAQGVRFGARKARFLVPLMGLAVLASVAFAQA
jgi:hypothetical protein